MYITIGNKERWRNLVERFVFVANVPSWTFLSSITKMEVVVRNGEKARKEWQTAYSRGKEKLTTLRCCVGCVMHTIISNLKTNLPHVSESSGIDVIVQRYVDYTGNTTVIKNGQSIVWQKTEKTSEKKT